MSIRQLKEYDIRLGFRVEAYDLEQAQEIARDLLNKAMEIRQWKVLDDFVDKIEEA